MMKITFIYWSQLNGNFNFPKSIRSMFTLIKGQLQMQYCSSRSSSLSVIINIIIIITSSRYISNSSSSIKSNDAHVFLNFKAIIFFHSKYLLEEGSVITKPVHAQDPTRNYNAKAYSVWNRKTYYE
jgi:hypothetical protein